MKIDKKNRRMFLQGLGGSILSIPFLESIFRETAFAQSVGSAKYFVAGLRGHHNPSLLRFKDTFPLASISGTNYHSADLPSNMSLIGNSFDDPRFTAIKDDMMILQGFDYGHASAGHTLRFPLTGRVNGENDVNYLPSVDQIMAASTNLRANKSFSSVLLDQSGGVSVDRISREPIHGGFYNMRHAFDTLFNGIAGQTGGPPNAADLNHIKFVDRVKADLDELMRNKRLSATDKERLSNHMELINTLESRLSGNISVPATCVVPTRPTGTGEFNIRAQEMIDLIFASINCNVSSVFTFKPETWGDFEGGDFEGYKINVANLPTARQFPDANFHSGTSLVHTQRGGFDLSRNGVMGANHLQLLKEYDVLCMNPALRLAERLKTATTTQGGNLLDETIIVSLCEHGVTNANTDDVHRPQDIQAVVFGNSPRFKTGKVFDFINKNGPSLNTGVYARGKPGRLYNHFLNTLLSAMNVDRSLWQSGAGEYSNLESYYSASNPTQIISEIFK